MKLQEILRFILILMFMRLGFKAGLSMFYSFELNHLLELISASIFLYATTKIKFSRFANQSFQSVLVTAISIGLPLSFSNSNTVTISNFAGVILIIVGGVISLVSLLELWSSFDILPSYKEVKSSGPYKFIRHPIYCGYTIALVGRCFVIFSLQNLIVSLVILLSLYIRAHLEEQLLVTADLKYQEYRKSVRYMIFPGVL